MNASTTTPTIELVGIRKTFQHRGEPVPVLKGVSLSVNAGEVVVLTGPSGSGKTTLLRCGNLLEVPDGGEVRFRGRLMNGPGADVHRLRRRVAMIFQRFHLFRHLDALSNVTLALRHVHGMARDEAEGVARACLGRVGLADRVTWFPSRLSGGEQQRLAIARALATSPEVLLFDEPTSALDVELVGEVLAVMRELAATGTTMIVVTHELSFAREAASRIVFFDEGRCVEEGSPERILFNASQDRTRRFFARATALLR